jgi:hypothetical protein
MPHRPQHHPHPPPLLVTHPSLQPHATLWPSQHQEACWSRPLAEAASTRSKIVVVSACVARMRKHEHSRHKQTFMSHTEARTERRGSASTDVTNAASCDPLAVLAPFPRDAAEPLIPPVCSAPASPQMHKNNASTNTPLRTAACIAQLMPIQTQVAQMILSSTRTFRARTCNSPARKQPCWTRCACALACASA